MLFSYFQIIEEMNARGFTNKRSDGAKVERIFHKAVSAFFFVYSFRDGIELMQQRRCTIWFVTCLGKFCCDVICGKQLTIV
jgi:hypothetical protein